MTTTMTNLRKYFLDLIHPGDLDAIREEEKAKGDGELMADLESLWEEEMRREPSLDAVGRQSLEKSKDVVLREIGSSGKRDRVRALALWLASTAALALFIFASLLVWKQHAFSTSLMSRMVETQTNAGDTTSVRMPDGTWITLSGSSCLTYPLSFSSNNRKVALSGEAYFNVAHDADNPFVVECKGFDVTVRGTKFNLRTRQGDRQSTIWLDEGVVDVKSEKTAERQTLRTGQMAQIDAETGRLRVTRADRMGIRMSWASHEMSFRDTPLYDVLATVCDNFGLALDLGKDINDLPFTGTLPSNSLSEVVKTLEIVYKVRIRVSGKVMKVERVNVN